MSVGLLLITHQRIGQELLQIASQTLGVCPLQTKALGVYFEDEPHKMAHKAEEMIKDLDSGSGVLILSDAYGSTPANIAVSAAKNKTTRLVTGVNLPMLLRIFNYHESSLDELTEAAFKGGRDGIVSPTT
ncbi:PTS fructose transporter subunit IIA [Halorhodospira halochloris]|uniref:PTS system n=1 Tax=Halorhodospira halochloris TaxID=1052 RepID=A0A0X8XAM8_HALHR|nr:PTS fructose transporter subunit IIA [Halorhodospira halochloris]MBK1651688.1 hypothetical protein [Halorhodospira halochloris]MCG5529610.1 PTS fructose transporter subunit IIA [Halorhodospira halochloris]MCG5548111.1 PTS fructose transporter subunit IIA [Halorhodospira halochloris]BAU58551.2 PTS system [Halorhodospira halochloris]